MEDISRLVDALQAYIELPEAMQQRTVPLVLDAINLVRSSFLPASGVASIPLEFRHTDYHADSQRVAENSALQPADEAQRPADSQRVEVEVDSTSGI
jgi:hypothetical protein